MPGPRSSKFDIEPTDRSVPESPHSPVPPASTEPPGSDSSAFRVPDHKASKPRSIRDAIDARRGKTDDNARTGSPRSARKESVKKATPAMPRNMAANIQTFYGSLGMGIMMFCQPCGSVWLDRAERLGETGEELCKVSPSARRTYLLLTQGSAATAHFLELGGALAVTAMHHMPGARDKIGRIFGHQHEPTEEDQAHAEAQAAAMNPEPPNGQSTYTEDRVNVA